MSKQKKQKPLIFDWDTVPDDESGFTEIRFPGYPPYYLNFLKLRHDPAHRVLWWIDIVTPRGAGLNEKYNEIVMHFAPDIPAAQRAAEAAFFRLLKAPKFKVVT